MLLAALAALTGLVLAVGGMCGAGPTDLSLLAVSARQAPSPDDARTHVPVPVAAEVALPAGRRLVRRRIGRTVGRFVGAVGRVIAARPGRTVGRRAPPLRGPPALVA
ncbi:hypothetical protein HC251_23470 [Iamia sp. SCSIO 61187]|uniref:hypothetical protein n=1 Tax=Iamia sp. SCSIO 61187 TaxID=2722752 RepID=UPI001C624F11|nr:hypothetical protein [Iamia sp. SCSIO 61187]QYG95095.1 hypothetical protein HC251_23470 [Iamia sp. SCSIO 61187]